MPIIPTTFFRFKNHPWYVVVLEIVSVDKVGRVVLPKGTRSRLAIDEGTKLLITEVKDDTLVLKKLDAEELKRQLALDLKDVDLVGLLKKVRDETDEKVRKAYPKIFG